MPPGGDKVGEAHVDIHVNAAPGEAELAAFRAKVDRDFEELARKKAEATLNLKSADFDKKIDEAKGKLDYFKMRRARATLDLAKSHFDAQIAEAEAELKALGKQKATVQVDSRQLRAANAEQRLMSKARALDERAALRQAKSERSLTTERRRASLEASKQRADLAKLSAEYEKLIGKQRGLEKSSRRVFSPGSIVQAEKEARKLERVASEADHVKNKIEQLGGSVEHLDPQFARNSSMLDRWLSKLGDTSVRLGPLTTSIKGLGLGLGLLGPLIFELGGGVASLIGTIGAGLAGAASVGAGALGGLATSALGVGLVIGPMVKEFKEVHASATSLSKAILKYGKGSEQAKTAQEALNHELKGVSPVAREAFESYGNLGSQWKKLTKDARPAVFNAFGQSLKTVQSLLPGFARESTKTTQVAAKAWDGWMKSLRSSEAKNLLGQLMGNFRASIPGLASGLASLAATIGRIGAAGAHFLPGLSNGFAEWANNLESAVGGGQQLQSDIGGLVGQMKDLGHLTQDTGSFLVHFFSASSTAGNGLVNSLDHVISKWDRWSQTAGGRASLKNFFGESKTATEDFASSLGHSAELLFQFSRATAPVANGLLKVVSFIGDVVSAADNLIGVKQVFQGIGIVLAGLFVASKVLSYADAIKTVAVRLAGYVGVETAAAAATEAEAAAATTAATALEAEAVAAGEADLALGAGAASATRAALGLEETASSAGLLSAALAPEVLIPAAAIAGLGILVATNLDTTSSFEDLENASRRAGKQMQSALGESTTTIDRYVAAQQRNVSVTGEVNAARQRLAKLQKEGASVAKITHAVEALNAAESKQAHQAHETGVVNRQQIKDQHQIIKGAEERVHAAKDAIKAIHSEEKQVKEMQGFIQGSQQEAFTKNMTKAERTLAAAKREVAQAQKQEAATAVPYERSIKGLKPISDATEQALHKLANTIGATATKKIGSFVNPQDVAKVTNLSNSLSKLGRGAQVKNIAVKSQGADQAISKLQRLQKQTNKVEGARASIKIGANDTQAQSRLKRVAALSQRVTGANNTVRILANSSNAEQAIARLRGNLKEVALHKYQARISAIDNTQGASNAAKTKLREAAGKKYTAHIDAVDNASAKAKKAEGAARGAAQKPYKLNITASNQQALSAIESVNASLATLHDKTVNVNVVTHKSGGFSGGPSATFYSPFAMGGLNDRELQRANEKAIVKQSGPSRRVNKPTMLVGEQAPQHHEYVIATNPAYREQNKRYLGQAAGDLGYEVIPAFKKGKGGGKKASGGGSSTPSAGPAPYKKQSKRHWKVHSHRFAPGAVEDLNTAEGTLSNLEGKFNAELDREEQEIAHKKRTAWDFATLKGFLTQEAATQNKIIHNFIPHIVEASTAARNKADSELKGPLSKGKVTAARKEANAVEREYSGLKAPTKKKGETDKEYANKKTAYERHKNALKRNSKEAKAYASRLEKERADAIKQREEAANELKEVRHEVLVEHETGLFEIETELGNVTDIEENPELAPYYESSKAPGGTGPTIGEQTASLNEARAGLYEQFASNVTAGGGPAAGTISGSSLVSGNGGHGSVAAAPFFSTMAAAAAMQANDHMVKRLFRSGSAPSGSPQASTSQEHHGKVVNVTNNFAAPPPDPHTWSRQQEFELGAL